MCESQVLLLQDYEYTYETFAEVCHSQETVTIRSHL